MPFSVFIPCKYLSADFVISNAKFFHFSRKATPALQADQLNQWLDFSNRFCGYSVQRYGAIDSYPTIDQL